ncbi:MAG: helix-turn-helix domain-containing protein [Myxococcota bacterium]
MPRSSATRSRKKTRSRPARPDDNKVRPKDVQAEATRQALLASARRLFAARGYAAVGMVELAKHARVTTGAVYHHFGSKQQIFRVAVEDITREVAEKAAAAMARSDDPWGKLMAGIDAVLDACLLPEVRMAYNEAPVVLGIEQWRALEEAQSSGLLLGTLASLVELGVVRRTPLELLVPMVKGAIVEAAMSITRARNAAAARRDAGILLDAMLGGLRVRA